jgi:uncharacterized membrane protein
VSFADADRHAGGVLGAEPVDRVSDRYCGSTVTPASESAGALKGKAVEIVLRINGTRFFDGATQYRLSRTYDNTNGIDAFRANDWDLSGEWSRADTDERHRFNVLGRFHENGVFTVGINFSVHSGVPYSLTTGLDDYRDGVANSRPPGTPRNSLQGPGYTNLDVRWSPRLLVFSAVLCHRFWRDRCGCRFFSIFRKNVFGGTSMFYDHGVLDALEWIGVIVIAALFISSVLFAALWLRSRSKRSEGPSATPLQILERRYAAGEISTAEYEERRGRLIH